MKSFLVTCFLFSVIQLPAQVNPANIRIARDSFGIPHIFAPTDAEAAYGLAWAHAEDDFRNIQLVMLSGQARLGTVLGKRGAAADFAANLLGCRRLVDEKWSTLSADFMLVVKGYLAGLNDYAKAFPEKVLNRKSLPFTEKDYLAAINFSVAIFCGADRAIRQVMSGNAGLVFEPETNGSNAFAFHSSKTETGEAFLAINPHLPLQGPNAFYEAHVQSDEGWNMLGGILPGSCVILHGTNAHLGWAHTVNYPDRVDIFQLKMNPRNDKQYRFDGKWLDLEEQKISLKLKGLPVGIGRKIYRSVYGPTLKTKKGVFSIRLPSSFDIRAMEQWYRMNKAKSFHEFYQALGMMSIPMFNIVYADRHDTIFYISNGKIPVRNSNPEYKWKGVVRGDTSATLWTSFKPLKALPQYLNPGSGYLYNTNHAPFLATDPAFNLDSNGFDRNDGYERDHNNRSQRVAEILKGVNKLDYVFFKKLKFDKQFPTELKYIYKIDSLLAMDADDFPELAEIIRTIQQWDRRAEIDSKGAAMFSLLFYYVAGRLSGSPPRQLTRQESVEALQYIREYLVKHYGTTEITLGDLQKLVRGNEVRPVWGLPDVLTSVYTRPYKNGSRGMFSGEGYICLVRYPREGLPVIESVNAFGASSDPASAHFMDQMDLFLKQQLKPMTLDKEKVLQRAVKIYNPGK